MSQAYYIKILWGEKPDSVDDDAFEEYALDTRGELEAFLWGVHQASGWSDYAIIDPQNILDRAEHYGSEADYRRDVGRELEEDKRGQI